MVLPESDTIALRFQKTVERLNIHFRRAQKFCLAVVMAHVNLLNTGNLFELSLNENLTTGTVHAMNFEFDFLVWLRHREK